MVPSAKFPTLCAVPSPIGSLLLGGGVNLPFATPLLLRFADLLACATVRPPTLPPLPPVPPAEGRPRLPAPVAVTVRRDFCLGPAIGKRGGSIWFLSCNFSVDEVWMFWAGNVTSDYLGGGRASATQWRWLGM